MKKWLPSPDAAEKLGISVRALYYRMKKGQLETKIEDGNRLILVNVSETSRNVSSNVLGEFQEKFQETDEMILEILSEKDARIKQLEKLFENQDGQLCEKDKQIQELHQLLAISQKSLNQLTEQNQVLLEDTRKSSFWQRLKAHFAEA